MASDICAMKSTHVTRKKIEIKNELYYIYIYSQKSVWIGKYIDELRESPQCRWVTSDLNDPLARKELRRIEDEGHSIIGDDEIFILRFYYDNIYPDPEFTLEEYIDTVFNKKE